MTQRIQVTKRNGTLAYVSFDQITERLSSLAGMAILSNDQTPVLPMIRRPLNTIDPVVIAQKICSRIYHTMQTSELDIIASDLCASMSYLNPEYGFLAGRICINNHQKHTKSSCLDVIELAEQAIDCLNQPAPLFGKHEISFIKTHHQALDAMIDHTRDYDIDFFGFKTLQRSYLLKANDSIIERPQHLWMRVAIGIHAHDISSAEPMLTSTDAKLAAIKETYDYLSCKFFTHATPTLFHAGTPRPQMSSCFLMGTEDSVEGIFKTISDTAMISKWAGGIGLHISNIRANGSYIRKTAGHSLGIMPMLKVYNDTARYINQSGRRNGSFAMYLEPWHADVFQFLDAKKNQGAEEERARDLFYALWIPDLFMKMVRDDLDWYLMCPDQSPGLADCYGDDFDKLYQQYIDESRFVKKIKARELWKAIINSQIETGTPYMLYKDAANSCSNQKNVGVIKSSNLCCEIMEYSDAQEYAVCNLASINLTAHVKPNEKTIKEIETWQDITIVTADECQWCTLLKGLLAQHGISYTEEILQRDDFGNIVWSEKMKQYDLQTVPQLFATIKTAAGNLDIPKNIGGYDAVWKLLRPRFDYTSLYETVAIITRNLNRIIDLNYYPVEETRRSNLRHRPIGIGVQGLADVFQMMRIPFDSMDARGINANIHETIAFSALTESCNLAIKDQPYETFGGSPLSNGLFQFDLWEQRGQYRQMPMLRCWDWEQLRAKIQTHGVRNSLLLAPMPTASTSQILGNNECFEPYTANIYTRRVLAGEFTVINQHLVADLTNMGLWNDTMASLMVEHRGSIQNIDGIPVYLKAIYKTAWELKQKVLVDMARDRGFYICQSQSLNLFFERPDYETLSKAHLYSWKCGLKTGSYYIRSKPALASQQFTVAVKSNKKLGKNATEPVAQAEPCDVCSS